MDNNINSYIEKAIERYHIKKIGFQTEANMAYVVLEGDSVFYGLPCKENTSQIIVQSDTVDNILQENGVTTVDLMIVQVNGSEIDVMQSMPHSIKNIRNFALAMPYNWYERDKVQLVTDMLCENGFDLTLDFPWIYASRKA